MSRKPLAPNRWWNESWNVVTGCNWDSEGGPPLGCEHCWAEGMARRFPAMHAAEKDRDWADVLPPEINRREWGQVITHPDRLDIPLKRKASTTFAVSLLGDLFHPEVSGYFLYDVAHMFIRTRRHRFIIPTKRYDRAADFFSPHDGEIDNVILMASVWDQESCDRACEAFAGLPVKWGLNFEPLLGPVDIGETAYRVGFPTLPSWVIVGAENGPGSRPMDTEWAMGVKAIAKGWDIPLWYKGNSKLPKEERYLLDGREWMEVPW